MTGGRRGPESAGPRAEQKRVRDLLARSRELLKRRISRTKNLLKLLQNLVLGSVEEKPGCL